MKLVKEIADMLVEEGREVNVANLNSKAMGFVCGGTIEAGKYESLTPGDAGRFMRDFHNPE